MGCSDSKPEVKNTKRLSSGGNKQALDEDLARMKEEAAKNSQEHKDSRGFMANSEKEAARLDLPTSEGKTDEGTLWYKYTDQRVKFVRPNGDVTITHVTGDIEKYEETGGIKTTKFRVPSPEAFASCAIGPPLSYLSLHSTQLSPISLPVCQPASSQMSPAAPDLAPTPLLLVCYLASPRCFPSRLHSASCFTPACTGWR